MSAPASQILVRVEGRLVGATIADGAGTWFLTLAAPLAAGRHAVQIASRSKNDGVLRHGEVTEITVPDGDGNALRGLTSSEEHAIEQARSFADEATKMFDMLAPLVEGRSGAEAKVLAVGGSRGPEPVQDASGDRGLSEVAIDWLDRSARHYQGVIVQRLALGGLGGSGSTVSGDSGGERGVAGPPRRAQVGGAEKDVIDQFVESFRAWFAKANKDYQAVIVRHLSEPAPTDTSGILGRPRTTIAEAPRSPVPAPPDRRTFVEKRAEQAATAKVADKSGPVQPMPKASAPPAAAGRQRDAIEIAQDALGGWFSRANRDYHAVIVPHLIEAGGPTHSLVPRGDGPLPGPKGPPPSGGGEISQTSDQADRLAALEKRRADEERADQERRRLATEASRRQAEEALRRSADETDKGRAAEEARRLADAQVQTEADRQRTMAADAARRAEAAKRAEDERRAGEDARRLAQAEAARLAAAQRIVEEQRRRIAEEDRRKAEDDKRRADDERRRTLEAERKLAVAAAATVAAEAARQTAERRAAERALRTEAVAEARARRTAQRTTRSKRAYSKAAPPRVAAAPRGAATRARAASLRTAAVGNAARPAPSGVRARVLRTASCPNGRVVVMETRTGVYNSVFNKDIDQRRVVMAYNSPLAANAPGCQTLAQRE